jgi:hypothetical protein
MSARAASGAFSRKLMKVFLPMRHRERVPDRNRRVHGISALAQNGGTHIGGQVLCRHDHAVGRFQCSRSGGARRRESTR